jgi:hypothetical protein
MYRRRATAYERTAICKLDALLGVASVALALQLFPFLGARLLWALDIRNWGYPAWLTVNLACIVLLVGIRIWPDLQARPARRRARRRAREAELPRSSFKDLDVEEQRKLFRRMQEARRRQVI